MEARQEAKLSMFRAIEKLGDTNPAILNLAPAFKTTFSILKSKITLINSAVQQASLVTKGIAIDKNETKQSLCRTAADTAAMITALASATSNSILKQQVNFSYSALLLTKDDALAPKILNIHALAVANLTALAPYGITAAMLASLLTAIETYRQKVPTPRNAAASKKTIKANIKNLIKETDTLLKEQMDNTVLTLKMSNADFVSNYKANRVIIDPAKTVTQLKGTAKSKDKKPMQNVAVVLDTTDFAAITNEKGAFIIKNIPFGNYTATATSEGYESHMAVPIQIKRGQINKITFDFVTKKGVI